MGEAVAPLLSVVERGEKRVGRGPGHACSNYKASEKDQSSLNYFSNLSTQERKPARQSALSAVYR